MIFCYIFGLFNTETIENIECIKKIKIGSSCKSREQWMCQKVEFEQNSAFIHKVKAISFCTNEIWYIYRLLLFHLLPNILACVNIYVLLIHLIAYINPSSACRSLTVRTFTCEMLWCDIIVINHQMHFGKFDLHRKRFLKLKYLSVCVWEEHKEVIRSEWFVPRNQANVEWKSLSWTLIQMVRILVLHERQCDNKELIYIVSMQNELIFSLWNSIRFWMQMSLLLTQ